MTFHLNTFEWNYYNGRREEKKLVAYILRTAKRLKIAEISAWDLDPEEQSQILKEVASLQGLQSHVSFCWVFKIQDGTSSLSQ